MLGGVGGERLGYLCYIRDSSTISSTSEIGGDGGIDDRCEDTDDTHDDEDLHESES